MAEDRHFFEARMNLPKPVLVAGEIAAATRINQKLARETFHVSSRPSRLHVSAAFVRDSFCDCPTFPHFSARRRCVLQEQMIEPGPFDLKCLSLARITAVAEHQIDRFRAIADM